MAQKINQKQFGTKYSTDEQLTGDVWIDGKPIYKKTISLGALPNSTTKSVAHGIVGLDYIVDYKSMVKRSSDGLFQTSPRVNTNNISFQSALELNLTEIMITSATNLSSYDMCFVTLYYTKV